MAAVIATIVVAASGSGASVPRAGAAKGAVPHVIIDSDLSRWWDDATAIGMANILGDLGVVLAAQEPGPYLPITRPGQWRGAGQRSR
jgi:hypothetical protein